MNLSQNEKGFSLIEVVVASVLLTAVLIPLLFTLLNSHKIVYKGQDYITTNNLITLAAEEVKAQPFGDVTSFQEDNYQGTRFSLVKTVVMISPDKLKQVNLEIKDGDRIAAKLSFTLYRGGF